MKHNSNGRRTLSAAERSTRDAEALVRASTGQSLGNLPRIYAGFAALGIPESEIHPRQNILTYHAWRARGRQVRRGQHGVQVVTYIDTSKTTTDPETGEETTETHRRPWTATVFHESQTGEMAQR